MKRFALVIAVLAALSACAPAEPQAFDFAVAGDSLTAWDNQSFPHPTGDFNTVTWTHWALGAEGTLVGGYAREDATADEIAAKIIPVEADLLVVMAGTNDARLGTPVAATIGAIEDLVRTAGVDSVLLSAIPPVDGSAELNAALVELAAERGWAFVDPWVTLRRDDGEWLDGSTNDGVHPSVASAEVVGAAVLAAMREAVAASQ